MNWDGILIFSMKVSLNLKNETFENIPKVFIHDRYLFADFITFLFYVFRYLM